MGFSIKKGFSTPYLRCVTPPVTTTILRELHEGYVACHEWARSIVRKALNQSYYWSTMSHEDTTLVHKCESCQTFTPQIGRPLSKVTPIHVAWPFVQWGIDYFSKWIEAKALASTTIFQVIKFLKSWIISRYGIPNILGSDNDPQSSEAPVVSDGCK